MELRPNVALSIAECYLLIAYDDYKHRAEGEYDIDLHNETNESEQLVATIADVLGTDVKVLLDAARIHREYQKRTDKCIFRTDTYKLFERLDAGYSYDVMNDHCKNGIYGTLHDRAVARMEGRGRDYHGDYARSCTLAKRFGETPPDFLEWRSYYEEE